MIYDINNFKSINDTYGHKMGDKVLIELSALLQSSLRENDYIYRVGGEEFMIILPHTKLDTGILICEKIKNLVEYQLNTIKELTITISIGVTEVKTNDTEDSIFTRVDNYLYESKNTGRNTITSDLSSS